MANFTKYPFEALQVGQGFVVPANEVPKSGLGMAISYWSRKTGRRFGYRTNADKSVTVFRKEGERERAVPKAAYEIVDVNIDERDYRERLSAAIDAVKSVRL